VGEGRVRECDVSVTYIVRPENEGWRYSPSLREVRTCLPFRVNLEKTTSSLVGNRHEVVSVRAGETSEGSTVSLLVAVDVHLAIVQTGLPSFSGVACNGHVRFRFSSLTQYSTVFVVGRAARLISSMCNIFDARHGLHYDEDSCRQPCPRAHHPL